MGVDGIQFTQVDSHLVSIGLIERCLDPKCLIIVRITDQDKFLRFLKASHLPVSKFTFAILVKNFDWSVVIGRQIFSHRELAWPQPSLTLNYLLYKGSYGDLRADFLPLIELPLNWVGN